MFKKSEIAAQVRQAIIDICGFPQEQVTEERNLEKDLVFDGLDRCELAMNLEEKFEIFIPIGEIADQNTVGDWIRLVEAKLEAKGMVAKAKGNAAP